MVFEKVIERREAVQDLQVDIHGEGEEAGEEWTWACPRCVLMDGSRGNLETEQRYAPSQFLQPFLLTCQVCGITWTDDQVHLSAAKVEEKTEKPGDE